MSVIDSNLRVRAVKYNNRICTFLDVKGQLAYDMDFFDGSEQLSDGTCISGTSDDNGGCTGSKNTEDDKGEATKWRTIIQIPYIQQVGNLGGYYDKDGKFFKEQECAKVALRIGPPKLYNLSTMNNSITLFTPPLYILNAMTKRDGDVATPSSGEDYGKTDFHYPEIEVKFGSESKKLSLGIGYIGDETSNPDENGSVTLTSTIGSVGAEAEVFVKKGFEISNYQPTFCLYRKVKDQDGVYQNPVKVQCIKRNFPEIDNASSRAIDSTLNPQKIVISADSENTFSSSKIVIKYLGGFGTNGIDDSCGSDDSCTNSVSLSNSDTSTTTCDSSLESYKICVQREKCSELNNECAQNEINIQNATAAGTSTASYLVTKSYCDDNLLAICNAKKGITSSSTISDFYQNSSITANYPNAYGWFNEICLSSGFSTKLKTVIAYKIDSNVDGKCKVKSTSPYLNDSDPNTNCDDGGEYPNCLCQEYVDGVTLDSDETSRTETAHEAGLCIDIPTPKTCSTIDYNPSPNSDSSDLEYISSSLGKTSYNDSTGVHASHQLRSNGSTTGHAEFSFALLGMNSISGTCNGFWQYNKNSSGVSLIPKMNCLNVNGIGQWDTTVTNPCIRYSCSAITTSEPNSSGSYGGVYDKNEIGENKGSNHGFAIWPAHTQTTDFPESYSATSCITGFKLLNSTTIKSNGVITGYSGGTLPSRNCDQLGNSKTPTNSCERISCSAINPTIPSSSSDSSAWAEWYDSGGATFSSVYASRSSTGIQSESISYGTCQESLGFFQANGASPPYRECDYLGNWGEVKNKCLTQCDAISTAAIASDSGHGYAYWSVGYGEVVATSTGCVSGYVQYPYPPRNKTDGSSYTLVSDGSQNYTTTIPEDISSDNRSASLPQRTCQQATFGGSANVWTNPSSSCVNKCPGSGTDSRINAGKTRHSTSSGTVDISWNDTDLGETAYIYSPDPTQNGAQVHTAAEYSYGRANDYYILARKCGSDGKWETPIPQCATNGGEILDSSASAEGQDSNATYTTLPSGSEQIVALGSTSSSGTCQSGYYKGSYNTATVSSYTCSYKDSNYKIDEVYYKYASGSDCEKYCTLTNNQTFTNSYFGGTLTNSGYYDVNSSVTLKCNSNYGSAIVYSGSRTTNTSYDCGETAAGGSSYYTSSIGYRGTTYPSSTCRSDGTWSSVSNACTSCRTCSYSANFNPIYGTTSIDADLCGDDGDFNFGGNSSYGTEGYNSDQTPLYSNSHNSGDYPLNNQDLTYCYSISSDISSCSESQFSSIIQGTKVNTSSSSNTLNHNNSMACVGRYRNESNNCSTDHAKGMIKYTCTDGVAFAKSICKWSW